MTDSIQPEPQPVLVVHGGAGSLDGEETRAQYRVGVTAALEAGLAVLDQGAQAAVRAAVVYMEAHTITNAGRGAALAADGTAALDAGMMDGATRRYGAVTGVRRSIHPLLLAERLLADGEYGRLLAPPDVDALLAEFDLPRCEPSELITERTRTIHKRRLVEAGSREFLDTVGAVALDADGHVFAAVSTGGISLKRPGRIGDSPVPGAGYWADDRVGACVTTGLGEVLLRQGTARRCIQLLADGVAPNEAAAMALEELIDHEGDTRGLSGLIAVTRTGEPVLDHNSEEMSAAWGRPGGSMHVDHLWRLAGP